MNELLAHKVASLPRVQLLVDTSGFVLPDGTISHLDLYDYLHLTPRGYRRVFEPVYDLLLQLLSESSDAEVDLPSSSSSSALQDPSAA